MPPPRFHNTRLRLTRAFSLIEILVSTAVLALLLVLLLQALSQMGKVGQSVRADASRVDNVGVAFDMMRRDFSNTLLSFSPTNTNSLQFLLNPTISQGGSPTIQNPNSIFLQAAVADNTNQGDIAEVGYFIRLKTSENPPQAQLCRLQIDPNNSDYKIGVTPTWIDDATLNQNAAASPPEYNGLLVDDAIGLWIRAIDKNGDYYSTWDSRLKDGELPAALDVALLVIDPTTATNHLSNLPALPTASTGGTAEAPTAMDDEIKNYLNGLPAPLDKAVRVFRTKFYLPSQTP
ncbi:MAG: hypothetical protein ACK5LK_09255 [Chthoniobacterales bacterium]